MKFCTFWRLKFTKLTKSWASKLSKTAVLEFRNSQKLISRKIMKFPHCGKLNGLNWIWRVLQSKPCVFTVLMPIVVKTELLWHSWTPCVPMTSMRKSWKVPQVVVLPLVTWTELENILIALLQISLCLEVLIDLFCHCIWLMQILQTRKTRWLAWKFWLHLHGIHLQVKSFF